MRSSRRRAAWLCAVASMLSACGGPPVPAPDAERAAHEAEVARAAGARGAWQEAADAWSRAFALTAPEPAAAARRAELAFEVGRHLVLAALEADADEGARAGWERAYARASLIWLDEAEALAPDLHATLGPRARLVESGILGPPQPERARTLRERFVQGVGAAREGLSPSAHEELAAAVAALARDGG